MGVMKRLAASTSTRELIRLAAAIEAREERKEIDHDARQERLAIQWEANDVGRDADDVRRVREAGPGGDLGRVGPVLEGRGDPARARMGEHAAGRLATRGPVLDVLPEARGGAADSPPAELEAEPPAWGDELPVRAQPGWYRLGRSFYRVGSGPFAHWGFPEPAPEPARHQLRLF